MVGDLADYRLVKAVMPGKYTVSAVGDEKPSAAFTAALSVSDSASRLEKIAAERFLTYLLMEDAQNALHCSAENDGYLPLNRASYRTCTEKLRLELSFLKNLPEEEKNVFFVERDALREEADEIYASLFLNEDGTVRDDAAFRAAEFTGTGN